MMLENLLGEGVLKYLRGWVTVPERACVRVPERGWVRVPKRGLSSDGLITLALTLT